MIKSAHLVTATTAMALGLVSLSAQAQDSFFERNRYVSVTERPQPEYDPVPIRLGAMEARAALRTGVGYRSNLFASTTNETGDTFALLAPSLDLQTTWSRHAIGASASAEHNEYLDTGSESATDLAGRLYGRFDATTDLSFTGAASAEKFNEPRSAPASDPAAAERIEVQRTGAEVSGDYEAGRIALRGRLGLDTYDYKDGRLVGGGVLEQDFRDHDQTSGSVRVSYAPARDWAVFAEGSLTERDYDETNTAGVLNRDSQGTIIRGGVNFELPILIRGDIGIGYHQYEFDDPAFEDVDGLSIQGNAEWFVTQLTTLSASASRRVVDPGLRAAAGATETAVSVGVDHELRRNWLINAGVEVSTLDFESINREDDRYGVSLGSLWKVNRNASVDVSYTYFDQQSDVRPFSDNRVLVTLTLTP